MAKINNLFSNPNVVEVAQLGNYHVLEFQKNFVSNPMAAAVAYYSAAMQIRQRQVAVELDNSSCILSAGAMQWTIGNIESNTNVKGVGDLFGKAIKGAATGESAIKPVYQGSGWVFLEPTYKHIILENVANLLEHDDGRSFLTVYNALAPQGYGFRYQLMDSIEYGNVPQHRTRIFIVAFKDEESCERF